MKSPFSKFSMIKLPKHRRFEFTPRHFDEDKERLDKRKKMIAEDLGLNENDERTARELNFRANMKENGVSTYRSNATLLSNIRLLVVLGALLAACYYIFINLDELVASLTK